MASHTRYGLDECSQHVRTGALKRWDPHSLASIIVRGHKSTIHGLQLGFPVVRKLLQRSDATILRHCVPCLYLRHLWWVALRESSTRKRRKVEVQLHDSVKHSKEKRDHEKRNHDTCGDHCRRPPPRSAFQTQLRACQSCSPPSFHGDHRPPRHAAFHNQMRAFQKLHPSFIKVQRLAPYELWKEWMSRSGKILLYYPRATRPVFSPETEPQ